MDTNPLVPTNMQGAAVPHRLAMGLPPSVPVSLGSAVVAPSRSLRSLAHSQKAGPPGEGSVSLASLRSIQSDAPSRFQNSRHMRPTMLGSSMRLSASDAALVALSAPPRQGGSPPGRPRPRDPITGDVPEPATAPLSNVAESTEGVFRHGSREYPFPLRGTIGSIGGGFSTRLPSRREERLEKKLWLEAQRRSAAERTLRTVTIHGGTHPPWLAPPMEPGTAPQLQPYLPTR